MNTCPDDLPPCQVAPFQESLSPFLTLCNMSLLIFLGIALATALLAINTFDQLKAMLKPVPVRANNGR